MPVRHITVLESSLLRSPKASEGEGGALGEAEALRRGNTVGVRDQVMDLVAGQGVKVSRADLLPTTRASEPGSTSAGYGDSLNDVASRMVMGSARKDLLPTPVVNDMGAGKTVERWDEWTAETKAKHQNGNGHGPSLNIEMLRLLPTPNTMDGLPPRSPEKIAESKERTPAGYSNLRESVVNELLPTPMSRDYKGDTAPHERDGVVQTDTVERAIFHSGEINMLPTPQVDDSKNTDHNQDRRPTLASQVWETERTTNWGKFEPAIRRWEEVIGRPAPAPTKPDGKDGAHRLSSAFTEWMMGVPEGWITDCGLTRNEELKACGNGVVPQQAELALRYLLGSDDRLKGLLK